MKNGPLPNVLSSQKSHTCIACFVSTVEKNRHSDRSLERSKEVQFTSRSPSPAQGRSIKNTRDKKHSQMANKDAVVEVILGPDQKGKMTIHKGERLEAVAQKFAAKYGLEKKMAGLLKGLLEKAMGQN